MFFDFGEKRLYNHSTKDIYGLWLYQHVTIASSWKIFQTHAGCSFSLFGQRADPKLLVQSRTAIRTWDTSRQIGPMGDLNGSYIDYVLMTSPGKSVRHSTSRKSHHRKAGGRPSSPAAHSPNLKTRLQITIVSGHMAETTIVKWWILYHNYTYRPYRHDFSFILYTRVDPFCSLVITILIASNLFNPQWTNNAILSL